jgi:zinc protease
VQGLPLDAEERLLALLRTVTPEQVQAGGRPYFGDDQLTVATLLPQPLDAKAQARRTGRWRHAPLNPHPRHLHDLLLKK